MHHYLSLESLSRSWLQYAGFSRWQLLLLGRTGSRQTGFSSCGAQALVACRIFPDQGSNQFPLHRQVNSYLLRHQGSPWVFLFNPIGTVFTQDHVRPKSSLLLEPNPQNVLLWSKKKTRCRLESKQVRFLPAITLFSPVTNLALMGRCWGRRVMWMQWGDIAFSQYIEGTFMMIWRVLAYLILLGSFQMCMGDSVFDFVYHALLCPGFSF